jgi:transcriptional regulator with XRE-family HTH domain
MATYRGDTPTTPFEAEAAELLPLITDASQHLATSSEIPMDMPAVIDKLFERIPAPNAPQLAGIDPYLADAVTYGTARCFWALNRPTEERRPQLRIALEQVRQALSYILEEAPATDARPPAEIAQWLLDVVDTTQRDLSERLGIAPRTFQRWLTGETVPSGLEASKLQLVARLTANLRHSLTGPGVLWWLHRPHPDLGGRAPETLLGEPTEYPTLIRLAAQTRSSGAA